MAKVIIAVVYAVEVRDDEADDPQVHTWERFTSELPEPDGAPSLFASNALRCGEDDVADPDFDIDVRSHDRQLDPVPYA